MLSPRKISFSIVRLYIVPISVIKLVKQQCKASFGSTCLPLRRTALQLVHKMNFGVIPEEGEETGQFNIFTGIQKAELTSDHLNVFLNTHEYDHASKIERDFRAAALVKLAHLEPEKQKEHLNNAEVEIAKTLGEHPANMHALRSSYMFYKICDESTKANEVARKFSKYQQKSDQAVRCPQKIADAYLQYLVSQSNPLKTSFQPSLDLYDEIESANGEFEQLPLVDRMDCWSKHSHVLVRAADYSVEDGSKKQNYAKEAIHIISKMFVCEDVNGPIQQIKGKTWVELAYLSTIREIDLNAIKELFKEKTGKDYPSIENCEQQAKDLFDDRTWVHERRTLGKAYRKMAKNQLGLDGSRSLEEWRRLLGKIEEHCKDSATEEIWHHTAAYGLANVLIMRCGDLHVTSFLKEAEESFKAFRDCNHRIRKHAV